MADFLEKDMEGLVREVVRSLEEMGLLEVGSEDEVARAASTFFRSVNTDHIALQMQNILS